MAVIQVIDAEANLLSKGFKKEQSKHTLYHFFHDGVKTGVHTLLSHGEKEIDEFVIGMIKRELKIKTQSQVKKFLKCELDQNWYISFLKGEKIIKEDPVENKIKE